MNYLSVILGRIISVIVQKLEGVCVLVEICASSKGLQVEKKKKRPHNKGVGIRMALDFSMTALKSSRQGVKALKNIREDNLHPKNSIPSQTLTGYRLSAFSNRLGELAIFCLLFLILSLSLFVLR